MTERTSDNKYVLLSKHCVRVRIRVSVSVSVSLCMMCTVRVFASVSVPYTVLFFVSVSMSVSYTVFLCESVSVSKSYIVSRFFVSVSMFVLYTVCFFVCPCPCLCVCAWNCVGLVQLEYKAKRTYLAIDFSTAAIIKFGRTLSTIVHAASSVRMSRTA